MADKVDETGISIIIPVYNCENYIGCCIKSVINSDLDKYEIIIIDDGSSDGTKRICEEYTNGRNVRYYYQKNQGQTAARREGLNHAKFKWILFLDADDWVDDSISILNKKLKTIETDVLLFGVNVEKDGEQIRANAFEPGEYNGQYLVDNLFEDSFFGMRQIMTMYMGVINRKLVERILVSIPTDIRMSEDFVCMLLVLIESNSVTVVDDIVYHYRVHGKSFSHNHNKELLTSERKLYYFLREQLSGRNKWDSMEQNINWFVIRDLLILDYGMIFDVYSDSLFPFDNLNNNDRVVFFGIGNVGEEILGALIKKRGKLPVFLVDNNRVNERIFHYIVRDIEYLLKHSDQYDKVVITVLKTRDTNCIYETLLRSGIPKKKISRINTSYISEAAIHNVLGI